MFKPKRLTFQTQNQGPENQKFDEIMEKTNQQLRETVEERFKLQSDLEAQTRLIAPEMKLHKEAVKRLSDRADQSTKEPLITETIQVFGETVTIEMDTVTKQYQEYLNYQNPQARQNISFLSWAISKAKSL
jgi:hypothetical protein